MVFSGSPASPTAWTQFNSTFTAPVNASFLTVRSTLTPDRYAFVDNFSLQSHAASAVPEPSTLLFFGAGLAAVPLRRRLKKRT